MNRTPQPSDDNPAVWEGENGALAKAEKAARGVRALTGDDFNALESVGGVRGLVEAVLPGLVYLILFVITQNLQIALIGSLGVAAIMVIARLIQGTPVTMAFSGVFGVAIGLYVAWKSGDAQDFYVWGLLVNAAYMLVLLVTVVIRWPGVGVLVEMLKSGFGASAKDQTPSVNGEGGTNLRIGEAQGKLSSTPADTANATTNQPQVEAEVEDRPALFPTAWRKNPVLFRAYSVVTWLWIGMFVARLVVQLPLYFLGDGHVFGISAFAALGAARLIMGVPLFALVLWLSWRIIRQSEHAANPQV